MVDLRERRRRRPRPALPIGTVVTITSRRRIALAATSLVLLLGACADEPTPASDPTTGEETVDPASGTCPVGTPDCVDADLGTED